MKIAGIEAVERSPLAFVLACIVALMLLLISEGSYWQSAGKLDRLGATADMSVTLQNLQWSLLDAQAARHGAANDAVAYRSARTRIDESFLVLDAHFSDRPQSQPTLAELHAAVAERLAGLEQRAPDRADPAGMKVIRAIGARLLVNEAAASVRSRDDLSRTLLFGRIGVGCLSAVSLLAWAMYLRQTRRLERRQQASHREVRSERDQLEVEAVDRTAQLVELTHHLQTAREDERGRLARDLHDELGALLTSAKLDAARIRSRLAGSAPEALERLAHLVDMLNSGIALKRRIVEDLRPSALDTLGLVDTLEILARDFGERSGVAVHCALDEVRLAPAADLVVYRLVQEAITNITKYAKATQVWVGLAPRDGMVEVSVRDDGVGFDTDAPLRSAYGLVGMRYRVEAEQGTLTVASAPGRGTLIRMTLPQAAQAVPVAT